MVKGLISISSCLYLQELGSMLLASLPRKDSTLFLLVELLKRDRLRRRLLEMKRKGQMLPLCRYVIRFIASHFIGSHRITSMCPCIALHRITLSLHYITLHCISIALRRATLQSHGISSFCFASHRILLQCDCIIIPHIA